MTVEEVRALAEPLFQSIFDGSIESFDVREDDDWSGAPSLYIDVFLTSGTGAPETEAWFKARRTLSDRLVASGELRFPYVLLRDRREEMEDAPDEAA